MIDESLVPAKPSVEISRPYHLIDKLGEGGSGLNRPVPDLVGKKEDQPGKRRRAAVKRLVALLSPTGCYSAENLPSKIYAPLLNW